MQNSSSVLPKKGFYMKIISKERKKDSFRFIENRRDGKYEDSLPKEIDFYFSPKKAAQFLDVSVKMIYELIQSGELKSQPVGRRIKRIKKSELEKWLSSQK